MDNVKTYPTAPEMAQALIDADERCHKAESDYQAALERGTDEQLTAAALEMTAAQMAVADARKPMTLAMILTRSMDDDLALYVARSLVKGETWMFHGDQRRAHLDARARTQAEEWAAHPFVPALAVTETVALEPSHGSSYPVGNVIVTLNPDGKHTLTIRGVTYRLVQRGE